jgi:hypothetical protein
MSKIDFEVSMLTSMALFRQLYNDREDVFSLVSYFIIEILKNLKANQVTLPEVTVLVNETFNFDLPDSIIRTGLRRLAKEGFLTINDKSYQISEKIRQEVKHDLKSTISKIEVSNAQIVELLVAFVESHKHVKLNISEKKGVFQSLCSFLIDESKKDMYSDYVSAFILKCKEEPVLLEKLNSIKEGIILHSGLRFGFESNIISKWKKPLVIFLDQEILFSIASYNGIVYESLTRDFLKLVKEINDYSLKRQGKKLISLWYLKSTKNDIDGFFETASNILSRNSIPDPHATAMSNILKDCKTLSDVSDKKTWFYNLLKKNDILEEDHFEYYSEEVRQYNIVSEELSIKAKKDLGLNDPYESIENTESYKYQKKISKRRTIRECWIFTTNRDGNLIKIIME